jgi:uncharacterized protein YbaP (TraB family)
MKTIIIKVLLIMVIVTGLVTPSQSGDIYKWRDENGVLHYSDTPPPDLERDSRKALEADRSSPAKSVPADSANRFIKGTFWKISKKGSAPSYLLGTIHSEDKRVLQIPPVVEVALNQADSFTMEVVMDKNTMGRAAIAMLYLDGNNLKKVLGDKLFQRVAAAMASKGIPPQASAKMKPWAVIATLGMPKPETGQFLDMVLYHRAKQQGKKIFGLESLEEQISVFDDMSIEDQIYVIREMLDYLPEMSKQTEAMIAKYLSGDIQGLLEFAEEAAKKGNRRISEDFYRRLNNDRNPRMVARMAPRLQEGNAFIAVGALHLPGRDGVLQLLTDLGYSLQAMN